MTSPAFNLDPRLAAKAEPSVIGHDARQFALIGALLDNQREHLGARLDALRLSPAGFGQGAVERDIEIHRLSAQLRVLTGFGLDLCLGRMVSVDDDQPRYVGRLGLTDAEGNQVLIDWRAPAAEPFFAATHAHPMGLASRRRYRWLDGRVVDYWDEAFTDEAQGESASLDDQSAFIASLGASRSPRMRDVLSTIAADQDAIIRADSRGALVVDGGPGTGKTVVALHRAAYLLYADARVSAGDPVLFVGPHPRYLAYAADVLPNLGEDSVRMCTLRDLVPEGAAAVSETDASVEALKSALDVDAVLDRAARFYEEPPVEDLTVETTWAEVTVTAEDWAEAFGSADPGASHDDARDQIWEALLDLLVEQVDDGDVPREALREEVRRDDDLNAAFVRAWPLLDPREVVSDLWSVPAYLRLCAPELTPEQRRLLRRVEGSAWTTADLPLLDAAQRRIGDPDAPRRRRARQATVAAELEGRAAVADHLIAADDSEMQVMSMLRGADLAAALLDGGADDERDPLTGPFAHVIVDEAQELTDAQWRMLMARCPSRSFTVAGDRAQARRGFPESWEQRLTRLGFSQVRVAGLTVNYRTPSEVMAVAEPVIRAGLPDANVPISVRESGMPVEYLRAGRGAGGTLALVRRVVADWCAEHPEGVVCVIGEPSFQPTGRVASLHPEHAKGLEFDLVVLVDPGQFGDGLTGAVDRYVAMTRATQQLIVVDR